MWLVFKLTIELNDNYLNYYVKHAQFQGILDTNNLNQSSGQPDVTKFMLFHSEKKSFHFLINRINMIGMECYLVLIVYHMNNMIN